MILYSADHSKSFGALPVSHLVQVVRLWQSRTQELSADSGIRYVFLFENRGPEAGATMLHPHGQFYAYPYVPQKIEIELQSCNRYFQEHRSCLLCDMNRVEAQAQARMVDENESFYAYLPHFTDYPFGVFVVARRHILALTELGEAESRDLASILKRITGEFDLIFDRPFPYMMVIHQGPAHPSEFPGCESYYHFHIEFYPPLRAQDKIKWIASSELGAGAPANPLSVEECAPKIREAIHKNEADPKRA